MFDNFMNILNPLFRGSRDPKKVKDFMSLRSFFKTGFKLPFSPKFNIPFSVNIPDTVP